MWRENWRNPESVRMSKVSTYTCLCFRVYGPSVMNRSQIFSLVCAKATAYSIDISRVTAFSCLETCDRDVTDILAVWLDQILQDLHHCPKIMLKVKLPMPVGNYFSWYVDFDTFFCSWLLVVSLTEAATGLERTINMSAKTAVRLYMRFMWHQPFQEAPVASK